ncbi:MAG: UbiA family prenyltransferase [Chitinophagales bacterium]
MSFASKIRQLNSISRAGDWRLSFIPFIIGCVYLWLYYFDIAFSGGALLLFILSLITSFGFAALGYFINEFFDKESDRKAGKINKLAFLKPQYQYLIFLAALSMTLLPWIKLPANHFSWNLIVLELLLFLIYSLPFPRLKEIPLVSNIIDAAYAYVIPLVLAFHTYGLYAGKSFDPFILVFAVPVFFIGFRNIFIHQVNDVFKDRRSEIRTLPIVLGVAQSNYFLKILLLLEFSGVVVFSVLLSLINPLFWFWLAFYGVFFIYRFLRLLPAFFTVYFPIDKARHLGDVLYQIWFPLFMLAFLLNSDWRWFFIIPVHFLILTPHYIFKPILQFCKKAYYTVVVLVSVHFRHLISMCVNYPIYYMFLLFGVNLIREKKSAMEYLKEKWS